MTTALVTSQSKYRDAKEKLQRSITEFNNALIQADREMNASTYEIAGSVHELVQAEKKERVNERFEKLREEIQLWLSSFGHDFQSKSAILSKDWVPGTGAWIFDETKFNKWIQ